jgi:hypothetical protein
MALQSPAREVLALMRKAAERHFEGSVSDDALFGESAPPDFSGFCVHVDGSMALVELGTAGTPDWIWFVQVTSGLALEVPYTRALMDWINEQNRTETIGKYYCTVSRDPTLVSIVYETLIPGVHFKVLADGNVSDDTRKLTYDRVCWEMRKIINGGVSQRAEIVNKFGGRFFDCSRFGLRVLFSISCGLDSESQDKGEPLGVQAINIEDLVAVLGRDAAEESVQAILQRYRLMPRPYDQDRLDNGFAYINRDAGIEIGGKPDGSIEIIFLHSAGHERYTAFAGRLPAGLTFNDTRESARAKLGEPEASAEPSEIPYLGPRGAWDRWLMPKYSLHISYGLGGGRIELVSITPRSRTMTPTSAAV